MKSGPDISCRKTGFRLKKKLKVQPGNTAGTISQDHFEEKMTLNAWYHEIVTIIFPK